MGVWGAGRGWRVLVVPVVAAAAVTGAGPDRAGASASCVSWTGVQPVNVGVQNALNDVAIASSCRAWAVGVYLPSTTGNEQAMIERWNGSAWTLQPSPNPGGTNGQALNGVAATSAANAWAVGFYGTAQGGTAQTLILHWNGATWAQVPSPNPAGGTLSNGLSDVVALSATRAWAVGSYGTSPTAARTLIVRWNGAHWHKVPSPNRGPLINELGGVAATSATNAWAVGDYNTGNSTVEHTLIEHWNGSSWKLQPSPNPGGPGQNAILGGVAATSATNAWATGYYSNSGHTQTLIVHWDGRSWKKVPSPSPGALGNFLGGVTAISATNAWTVGNYVTSSGVAKTLIVHWDGRSWKKVPSPNPGSALNFSTGVAAASATNIWAVGTYSNSPGVQEKTLALHCC